MNIRLLLPTLVISCSLSIGIHAMDVKVSKEQEEGAKLDTQYQLLSQELRGEMSKINRHPSIAKPIKQQQKEGYESFLAQQRQTRYKKLGQQLHVIQQAIETIEIFLQSDETSLIAPDFTPDDTTPHQNTLITTEEIYEKNRAIDTANSQFAAALNTMQENHNIPHAKLCQLFDFFGHVQKRIDTVESQTLKTLNEATQQRIIATRSIHHKATLIALFKQETLCKIINNQITQMINGKQKKIDDFATLRKDLNARFDALCARGVTHPGMTRFDINGELPENDYPARAQAARERLIAEKEAFIACVDAMNKKSARLPKNAPIMTHSEKIIDLLNTADWATDILLSIPD